MQFPSEYAYPHHAITAACHIEQPNHSNGEKSPWEGWELMEDTTLDFAFHTEM